MNDDPTRQAHLAYKEARLKMLDQQQRARDSLALERQRALSSSARKLIEAYRPALRELARRHGHEQRLAASPRTTSPERARFIFANRERLGVAQGLRPQDIAGMMVSRSSFAKAIARLHEHERRTLNTRLDQDIEQQAEPIRQIYQQRMEALDLKQEADRHRALGGYVLDAPHGQTALQYLERDGLIPEADAASAPKREQSGLVDSFNEKGLQSPFFQRRSEQIRIQMADWRNQKGHTERERDEEHSR